MQFGDQESNISGTIKAKHLRKLTKCQIFHAETFLGNPPTQFLSKARNNNKLKITLCKFVGVTRSSSIAG